MLVLNFTLVLVFVSFALFVMAMRSIFFEPLRQLHHRRQARIAQDKQEADQALAQYFEAEAQVTLGTTQAHQHAASVVAQARLQARQQAASTIKQAKEASQAELLQIQQSLTQQATQAKEALKTESEQLAQEFLTRLLPSPGAPVG